MIRTEHMLGVIPMILCKQPYRHFIERVSTYSTSRRASSGTQHGKND